MSPVTPARLTRLLRLTAEYDDLKQELKRRAMIYQYDAKVRVAQHFNLPFDQVDVAYADWCKLRQRYHDETGFDP